MLLSARRKRERMGVAHSCALGQWALSDPLIGLFGSIYTL